MYVFIKKYIFKAHKLWYILFYLYLLTLNSRSWKWVLKKYVDVSGIVYTSIAESAFQQSALIATLNL